MHAPGMPGPGPGSGPGPGPGPAGGFADPDARWQRLSPRSLIVRPLTDLARLLPLLAGGVGLHGQTRGGLGRGGLGSGCGGVGGDGGRVTSRGLGEGGGGVLGAGLPPPGPPEDGGAARAFATWTLGEGGACTDIAVLLTSELVTNSLQHGGSCRDGGSVTVTLIAIPGGIRAEVTDEGGPTVPTLHDGHGGQPDLAESGRGLQLVEVLSARWGYFRDGTGTMTWFELMEPHE